MGIFNYVFQGPCGGWGGNAHDPWLIPEDGVLTGFEVFSGEYINKIKLFYTSPSVAPNGAHPSYTDGYTVRDNDFYVAWDAISRDRDTFRQWMEDHVLAA